MTDIPTPQPNPDLPSSPPPRKANWKRTIGCIAILLAPFTIAPPGCLFWYFHLGNEKAVRDARLAADRALEALAKDAEGESQLHAWAVQLAKIAESSSEKGLRWERGYRGEPVDFEPPYDSSKDAAWRSAYPRVPTPLPAVMEETLAWESRFRLLSVTRSTKLGEPRTAIRISNWERAYTVLILTDEYLDNDPPPAAAFRNATPAPPPRLDSGSYSNSIDVAPGFRISYGFIPVG